MRIKFLNDSINGWLQTLDRTANLHKQAHKGELSTTTAAQLTTTEGYGDEGVWWIRGHHADDSAEAQALAVASALTVSRERWLSR